MESGAEPVSTMFRVYCDGEKVLCPSGKGETMHCATAHLQ